MCTLNILTHPCVSDLSEYFYPEITLWQYVVVLGAAGIASQRIFSGHHTVHSQSPICFYILKMFLK